MKKTINALVALLLLVTLTAQAGFGQRKRGAAAATPATNTAAQTPLTALPASDAVMLLDIKRVINEALPRLVDPEHLLKINAEIEKLKTNYGLDARSFEKLAVGFRFHNPRPGVTTTDMIAVVSGTFNSGALLAAGRMAAKGKYTEEKLKGVTINIYEVNDQINIPGMSGMKIKQLAVAALDAHTLVLGEPDGVRSTINTTTTRNARARANADLIQMAQRNPNSFISFGANVPASLTQGQDFGNDEITKNVTSIRQAFGALGITTNGVEMQLSARTLQAEQAKSLGDTLSALKQFGGMAISQLPANQRELAQAALDNLTITTAGNETQLRLELPQATINELMRALNKAGQKQGE